jgi:hypothetical protein
VALAEAVAALLRKPRESVPNRFRSCSLQAPNPLSKNQAAPYIHLARQTASHPAKLVARFTGEIQILRARLPRALYTEPNPHVCPSNLGHLTMAIPSTETVVPNLLIEFQRRPLSREPTVTDAIDS